MMHHTFVAFSSADPIVSDTIVAACEAADRRCAAAFTREISFALPMGMILDERSAPRRDQAARSRQTVRRRPKITRKPVAEMIAQLAR